MKFIIGLGNPGEEYSGTKHNIGFTVVKELAKECGIKVNKKMHFSLLGRGKISGEDVTLVLPQTYMNLSGQAVGALTRFYEIPCERLLVCSDDIDLPLGTLRLRPEGGSAGQKGLESIMEHLGTKAFPRLRLGIGRPSGVKAAAGYVLRDFKGEDLDIINVALDRAVEAIESFLREGIMLAMSRFNGPAEKP